MSHSEIAVIRRAYDTAKSRCNNPNDQRYNDYGGRGIKFKFKNFEQWFAELGPKPSPQHSVDRKNNDGNYEPGNLRWATSSEQRKNSRPYHAVYRRARVAVAAHATAPAVPIAPDGFMTRAEAAAFCRLNVQTIDQAIHQHKTLRAYHVGRRVLLKKQDVIAWIESREV